MSACPDLVVDSVRTLPETPVIGEPAAIRAFVRNIGDAATPRSSQLKVRFGANGELVDSLGLDWSIDVGEAAGFECPWRPTRADDYLVSATVNPGVFRELDLDNNTRYQLTHVTRPAE